MSLLAITPTVGTNAPGIVALYCIASADVTSIGAATNGEVSAFTLASGKHFVKLTTVKEETTVGYEMQGALGAQHYKQMVVGKIKGTETEVLQALHGAVDVEMIVVAEDANGKKTIVGSKEKFASLMTNTGNTGKMGSTDRNGIDFTIDSIGHLTPPLEYTGTIASLTT